jgi:hypothetical protein
VPSQSNSTPCKLLLFREAIWLRVAKPQPNRLLKSFA